MQSSRFNSRSVAGNDIFSLVYLFCWLGCLLHQTLLLMLQHQKVSVVAIPRVVSIPDLSFNIKEYDFSYGIASDITPSNLFYMLYFQVK